MLATQSAGAKLDTLIMLVVTSAVIPIFKRLNLSPILGFLLMGTVLGKHWPFLSPAHDIQSKCELWNVIFDSPSKKILLHLICVFSFSYITPGPSCLHWIHDVHTIDMLGAPLILSTVLIDYRPIEEYQLINCFINALSSHLHGRRRAGHSVLPVRDGSRALNSPSERYEEGRVRTRHNAVPPNIRRWFVFILKISKSAWKTLPQYCVFSSCRTVLTGRYLLILSSKVVLFLWHSVYPLQQLLL